MTRNSTARVGRKPLCRVISARARRSVLIVLLRLGLVWLVWLGLVGVRPAHPIRVGRGLLLLALRSALRLVARVVVLRIGWALRRLGRFGRWGAGHMGCGAAVPVQHQVHVGLS